MSVTWIFRVVIHHDPLQTSLRIHGFEGGGHLYTVKDGKMLEEVLQLIFGMVKTFPRKGRNELATVLWILGAY